MFRLPTMYKMVNKKVPEYLSGIVPQRVGARAVYNLRNGENLSLVRTRHVKTYNSSVPKTVRDWNSLGPIKNSITVEGFKTRYKNQYLRRPNKIFNLDYNGCNMHWTRLRLGLSHLAEHLFTNNIINNPMCQNCHLEAESTAHYLLRCPYYGAQRAAFLSDLLNVLDAGYIDTLSDNDIVEFFLKGNDEFPYESNVQLAKMAQTYIHSTERFQGRAYH